MKKRLTSLAVIISCVLLTGAKLAYADTAVGCCLIMTQNVGNDTTTTVALPLSQEECGKRNSSLAHTTALFTDGTVADDKKSCISNRTGATGEWEEIQPSDPIPTPILSVKIPDLKLTDSTCDSSSCSSPWLADYIQGAYKYGIAAVSLLAALALMIAGVFWLTAAGNSERIASAKKWIQASLAGLLIVYSPYLLLSLINGSLIRLTPVRVKYVASQPLPFSLSEDEYQTEIKQDLPDKLTPNMPPKPVNRTWLFRFVYNKFDFFPAAYASDFFNPPSIVNRYSQCANSVRYKDYSCHGANCKETCSENSEKKNEVYGEKFSTICTSGCGLASLYMVLEAYGASVLPYPEEIEKMARWMEDNGYRACGAGTVWEGLVAYAKTKGLTGSIIKPDDAFALLDYDYPIIIVVGEGKCTSGGHFMVATGKRGKKIYLNDPKSDEAKNLCSDIQTNEPSQKGYIYIHPQGKANIKNSSCVADWDWNCTNNASCCNSGMKCVNVYQNPKRCQSCILEWQYQQQGLPCCGNLQYKPAQGGNRCEQP